MRTALRTSIVTAALAGALLAPAATAIAATAPQPVPVPSTQAAAAPKSSVAPGSSASDDNGRYEGRPVYVGNGMVAVLRNEAEGPEAWIRYVGDQWKPGDNYMLHVVGLVTRGQTTAEAYGASFKLTKAETTAPVLVVTTKGVAKSYPLPEGKAGQVCSAEKSQDIGAGMSAKLFMSPDGPRAELWVAGEDTAWRLLDRGYPALPESAGIIARIVNPSGAAPGFEWKTQGGGTPLGRTSFPALPKGCKPNYKVTEDQATDKPAPKPEPTVTVSAKPVVDVKPQGGAQTVVVPKGGVAAGAELAAEDTDNSTTVAAGAGLVAIFAGLGVALLARGRRAGRSRG
ncbi:hypothetical protein ADK52_25020 [Streptomyces sp. WM6372]|uniref:hypothetical protein n=1 Tax=Streptomyces sp. WM6372 TaxID=1415555 RepID=UPI0006ADC719|nr:hypothetical protein [Streptomyces sp. WM6372]KOU21185.1 hypothetical protein ADK52_25020 [Streptomyces sp. WM6372]